MRSMSILGLDGRLVKLENCGVFVREGSAARRGIRVRALLMLDRMCLMEAMR